MEKKIKYKRNNRSINEPIAITEAYRVYALNNNLPAYNENLKEDGDYFVYLNEEGVEENKKPILSYDEMIAKIISTIFKNKNIYVNKKIVDDYISKNDTQGLGAYFASELENDINVEVHKDDSTANVVLRFGKNNALDMGVGAVVYDEKNEIHVAFGRVRRAMYDIAETLCE